MAASPREASEGHTSLLGPRGGEWGLSPRARESEGEDFSFPSPASVSLLARESMENSFSSWSFARNSFILHASSSTRDSCVESELFVSQASEDGGLDGHGNVELDVVHVMFPLRGP